MWMRVDDGLHAHRKTRAVTKSHFDKSRDAAPMGLWVLAGSWSARNNRDGWVPCDELDRFDDDWESLSKRLVDAGYWWPEQRDGEDGYGFNDWQEWNSPDGPSASGSFGNHVRWHVNKGVVKDECDHCPKEPATAEDEEMYRPESHPTRPDHRPDIAPESGGESGGESLRDHRPESLTQAQSQPMPNPNPELLSADKPAEPDRFDEFWDAYGKKVKRADAEKKWAKAIRKADPDVIVAAAREYVDWERANNDGGRYIADPSTWLHGERWNDERTTRQPMTRVQEHLTLVQQLAAEEHDQPALPQIGYRR